MRDITRDHHDLPVVIIGAGPVGLAAAAHVREWGLTALVLEAGDTVAAAIREWGHTRLFSPWRYNIDAAARRLLEATGWQEPDLEELPTGHELVDEYLAPLAAALGDVVRTGVRVVAVSRQDMDKTRGHNRATTPFLVRVARTDGSYDDVPARNVLDASGTWAQHNPLGRSGLPAPGETEAAASGLITQPLPAVTGADRERFAGRHVLVIGAGHSAANTLLDLAELAQTTRRPGSAGRSAPQTSHVSTVERIATSSPHAERSGPACGHSLNPESSMSTHRSRSQASKQPGAACESSQTGPPGPKS